MKKRQLKKSIKMPLLLSNLLLDLIIANSIEFNILVKIIMIAIAFILFIDE